MYIHLYCKEYSRRKNVERNNKMNLKFLPANTTYKRNSHTTSCTASTIFKKTTTK